MKTQQEQCVDCGGTGTLGEIERTSGRGIYLFMLISGKCKR